MAMTKLSFVGTQVKRFFNIVRVAHATKCLDCKLNAHGYRRCQNTRTRTHAATKAVIAASGERFNSGILTNIDIAQRSRELADIQSTVELLAREDDCLMQWPQVALASLTKSSL